MHSKPITSGTPCTRDLVRKILASRTQDKSVLGYMYKSMGNMLQHVKLTGGPI